MYNCIVSDFPILTVSLKTKLNPPLYWALGSSHDHTIKIKEIFTPVALPKDIGSIFQRILLWIIMCASVFVWQRNIFDGFFVFSHGVNQGKHMPG